MDTSQAQPNASENEIRRVVVVHFDTTRVDDFGCYDSFVKTPTVDGIAARGLRYLNAVTCSPYTSPSVATFMTGQYPLRHGVRKVGYRMNPEATTLAESLQAHGFKTGGFVSNRILLRMRGRGAQSLGYDQGFDVWRGIDKLRPGSPNTTPNCDLIAQEALDFVRQNRDDKFFLWMLHFDPHTPYNPPAPYEKMYLNQPELLNGSVDLTGDRWKSSPYKQSHEFIARHKAEVTMVDSAIEQLVAEIESLEGTTLYILLADHGESFGDADLWFDHGPNIRHPSIDVPLIMTCDGVIPIGTRDALVDNTDLLPTILELVGVPLQDGRSDGRSLTPTFDPEDPWPNRVVPIATDWTAALNANRFAGARSKSFSLHSSYQKEKSDPTQTYLYDRTTDPKESLDLSSRKPDVTANHLLFLDEFYKAQRVPATGEAVRTPEMRERLQSLGYVD
jgi:arylsulfatase A-like enzyme